MDYEEEKIKVPRFNEQGGFYTTEKRSKLMGKIGGRDTKPELRLRKALWNKGVRYRVHNTQLPGKPDISIKKYKLAVFIDGEFWHGYNWPERKHDLKSNRGFWIHWRPVKMLFLYLILGKPAFIWFLIWFLIYGGPMSKRVGASCTFLG